MNDKRVLDPYALDESINALGYNDDINYYKELAQYK